MAIPMAMVDWLVRSSQPAPRYAYTLPPSCHQRNHFGWKTTQSIGVSQSKTAEWTACLPANPRATSMRRSIRAPKPAAHKREIARAISPSVSETTIDASPSTTPSPEEFVARHAILPGNREDGTPKRPMNAFILFSNEKRSQLADLNPHLCAQPLLTFLGPGSGLHSMEHARRDPCLTPVPPPPPRRSNAAVSVLLGQSWRDMSASQKASYVAVARKIKEDFVALHPDARSRGGSRKGKRKLEKLESGGPRVAVRNVAPPSLHALALVGSRLNLQRDLEDQPPQFLGAPSSPCQPQSSSPSLLDQLLTVAENEHTAAAQMLSALAAF